MKKIAITLGLIIGMIHLLQAQSNKVFLPYLEAINIKKEFQISSTKLLKNYIDLANKFQVVMDGNKDTLFDSEKSMAEIKSKAQQLDAAYFIKGSLNRIGENVIINVSMFETATGNKIWFDQLKAMTPEDLDPIMQRIGNSIGTQTKATSVDDIYSVTNQETAALNQKQTNNSFGGGIGGIVALNNYPLLLTTMSLGWYFDSRNFIFDIRPTWGFDNSDNHMFNIALEMFKPHTSNSNSLYYGGGVSYSTSSINVGYSNNQSYLLSGSGINISAGGGYLFNRTSSVSMRVGGNLFYGIHDIKYTTPNNVPVREASPFGIELKVEILFKR
jgi:hypothetical protein